MMMKKVNQHKRRGTAFLLLLMGVLYLTCGVFAGRDGWRQEDVNWRISGGMRIEKIRYPDTKPLKELEAKTLESASVLSAVIDSPPRAGFVPWIIVVVTKERGEYRTTRRIETGP